MEVEDDDDGGGGEGQRGEEVRTTRALRNDGGREAEKKIWAVARRQGRKGAWECDSRGARLEGTEETGGRARSGGNSAINTNIFRSVLQPCFDNHPLQRSGVPSPSCDSNRAAPSESFLFPRHYPFMLFPPVFAPLSLDVSSDLKYVDTLTHAVERATTQTYVYAERCARHAPLSSLSRTYRVSTTRTVPSLT